MIGIGAGGRRGGGEDATEVAATTARSPPSRTSDLRGRGGGACHLLLHFRTLALSHSRTIPPHSRTFVLPYFRTLVLRRRRPHRGAGDGGAEDERAAGDGP